MPPRPTSQPPIDAARALMDHLRDRPDDIHVPASELARKFGLPDRFVKDVQMNVRASRGDLSDDPWITIDQIKAWIAQASNLFDRVTAQPLAFLAGSLCIALMLAALASVGESFRPNDPAVWGWMVPVLVLHLLCYYRHAMTRIALYGGLILWVVVSAPLMVLVWIDSDDPGIGRAGAPLLVAALIFLLAAIYSGAGVLASVFGSWTKFREQEIRRENMTRQELLERYFELQERLDQAVRLEHVPTWEDWPIFRAFRKHVNVWAAVVGLAHGLLGIVVAHHYHYNPFTQPSQMPVIAQLIGLSALVVVLVFVTSLAFFAGRPWQSAGVAIVYCAARQVISVSPLSPVPAGEHLRTIVTAWLITSMFYGLLCAAIGAASAIQHRAMHDRSLQRNDHATLIGEMLHIQWKLSDEASVVCVLVIDVVKSSEMKLLADPLTVEYSFREYQTWILEHCQHYHGRVHSTAGDGAVVAFTKSIDALKSARKLQSDLVHFNREINRLPSPFRVRIGLHVGRVEGDLDEVQFTEVIDIAAHVQYEAPVAGIAVTDDVVAQLPEEAFIPLARQVDRHLVYLVRNPTEY